jgi:hypothetical protein
MMVSRRVRAWWSCRRRRSAKYRWHPSVDRLVAVAMAQVPPEQSGRRADDRHGDDGATRDDRAAHKAGGLTIAEAEETAVVWGMPGESLVKAGGADFIEAGGHRGPPVQMVAAMTSPSPTMSWSGCATTSIARPACGWRDQALLYRAPRERSPTSSPRTSPPIVATAHRQRRAPGAGQRLHRQRDLFLSRGAPADVPGPRPVARHRSKRRLPATRCGSGRCLARPARRPIPSPCGCWKTGAWSTPTTSRSSGRTSTPTRLEAARAGLYGERALSRLPESVRQSYFEPAKRHRCKIIDDLRESVTFTHANLIDGQRLVGAGPVRRDLLPQRADLFRRGLAVDGGANLYDRLPRAAIYVWDTRSP